MKQTLYYFVDTNLFIQCLPLEQLSWSPWKCFKEVRLIVSSPVLRELDHLKTKGNGRVSKRARAASAMFRQMLQCPHKTVSSEHPRVILSVEPQHTYDQDLEDQLNYQERDDQLVGIVHMYSQCEQSSDVRLLTHDTAPIYIAQSIGVKADLIADDWLLPPETTKMAKALAALKAENARLRATEPTFLIRFTDQSGAVVDKYSASYTFFEPLTDTQIQSLMRRLKMRYPVVTDFRSREAVERAVALTVLGRTFSPPTDQEIKRYQSTSYPQWLRQCERTLRTHHEMLQNKTPTLEFTFLIQNTGTRPATDALVTIKAEGKFQIMPPPPDDQEEGRKNEKKARSQIEAVVLPRPPEAPQGHWKDRFSGEFGKLLPAIDGLVRPLQDSLIGSGSHPLDKNYSIPPIIRPGHRDANAFYYKPVPLSTPHHSFAIECAQWRHDNEAEPFIGEICVPPKEDQVSGLLTCRIQAANLAKAVSICIPIQISIDHISAFVSASNMVEVATSN